MSKLNNNHWVLRDYCQRMTTKDWKEILLNGSDSIIYHGRLYKLKAKRLGAGVVEVYKGKSLYEEENKP